MSFGGTNLSGDVGSSSETIKKKPRRKWNKYQEWIEMIKSDEIKIEQLSFKSLFLPLS